MANKWLHWPFWRYCKILHLRSLDEKLSTCLSFDLLLILGPSGAGRTGTVPNNVEIQGTLFARILRKVAREGIG
jgi:hypothetical protein